MLTSDVVQRAAQGDAAAFAALVAGHQDLAVGYAYALLGDHALAEDAAQEAFLELLTALPALRRAEAFVPWLKRIVFKHVDRIRRRADYRHLVFSDDVSAIDAPADTQDASDEPRVDARVVRAALAALPRALRETLVLHYYDAHGVGRIAAFLGVPAGTVKSRLHTARTRIREVMERMVEDELRRHRPSRNQEFVLRVALFAAARGGDLAAVERILAAAPQLATAEGPHPVWGGEPTALHVAIESGRADVVRLLLAAGADPNHPSERYDGWTPLLLAARKPDILALLRAHGARAEVWEAAALGDVERLRTLLDAQPSLARARRTNDAPPLHFAATVEAARLLVERGAPAGALDKYGATATRAAAYGRDRRDVARYLATVSGERDAWLCAALDDVDGLRSLADDGVDVAAAYRDGLNPGSGFGERPIETAAALGNAAAVAYLLSRGADPNALGTAAGPLHYAAKAGAGEVVALLLARGADPRALDDRQRATPADWARYFGHVAVADRLDAWQFTEPG